MTAHVLERRSYRNRWQASIWHSELHCTACRRRFATQAEADNTPCDTKRGAA